MKNKSFDNEFVHFEIIEEILYVTFKEGGNINSEVAQQIVMARLKFIEGKTYPILVQDKGMVSFNKEARECFSSGLGLQGVKAGVILVNTVFTSFLGNFFLRVNKPKIPTKIFTNKAEALKWLENYK